MPRFSQWEQLQDDEHKRPRPFGDDPHQGWGFGFGLDLTQPPESPELTVALPEPVNLAHELSQRVTVPSSALPLYDDVHAKLARLDKLDEVTVGKHLTKAEASSLLAANDIHSFVHGASKGRLTATTSKTTVVSVLLQAIKDKRIGSTLAEAQRQGAVDDEDEATQPPDEDAAVSSKEAVFAPITPAARPPLAAASSILQPRAVHAMDLPLGKRPCQAKSQQAQRQQPAEPHAPPPPQLTADRPTPDPPTLNSEEEAFVWKLLTRTLQPLGLTAELGLARRNAQTQTDAEPVPAARPVGTGSAPSSSQPPPMQSQACVVGSQTGYFSNGCDMSIEVSKVRTLLKSYSASVSDDEIREALGANGGFLQAVEQLRTKFSARANTPLPYGAQTTSDNQVRMWENRLATGSLF
ncbi:hypothetical protein T492DRAFT_1135847 [Pavlovales sp. CCMP2436]|nr:hypothetical protein T492DRAFT_1135847 [Pavlovales sp. CCMP2436]